MKILMTSIVFFVFLSIPGLALWPELREGKKDREEKASQSPLSKDTSQ